MTQYPKTNAGIVGLAESMLAGFTEHADIFTQADPAALQQAMEEFNNVDNALAKAKERLATAAVLKREKLSQLHSAMKRQIKQAEIDCADAPEKLTQIGWGPRSNRKETEPPAQPVGLTVAAETDSTVFLEWRKSPKAGSTVKCYNVERRQADGGNWSDWQLAATALDIESFY